MMATHMTNIMQAKSGVLCTCHRHHQKITSQQTLTVTLTVQRPGRKMTQKRREETIASGKVKVSGDCDGDGGRG